MPLAYTTITGTFDDGTGTALSGTANFVPSATVYSAGIPLLTAGVPITAEVANGQLLSPSGGALRLLATDNTGLSYPGLTGFFYWSVTLTLAGQVQPSWSFFLPSSPSTVDLYALAHTSAGGGSGVTSVTAGDASIAIGGTGTAPTVETGTLDKIAQLHPPIAAVGFNGQKATGLANGTVATDAAAFGQIPTTLPPNGSASGDLSGSYPGPTVAKVNGVAVTGTPSAGYVPTATGPTAATWQAPSGGTQAWQFQPETYGAKRDGAFLYDAAMTSGSAVLTTAGLPAPAATTLSQNGTGGTILAGTYQAKITYVNQYGETLASVSASVTTSGSTSTITATSPKPWTNATAWYLYLTQPGGSTYTRQQTAGSPTPLRQNLTLTAPPTSSGAQPPASNTSNSAPFTAGDVGKFAVIPSAGGFLNVPLATTIASYQSATQVTLTASASSTVTGSGAVYGTDDTAAIQAAINAAVTYAQASEHATGQVVFGNGIYCIGGAPGRVPTSGGGSFAVGGNCQIAIPFIDPYSGPKVQLSLIGPVEAPGPAHWEQANPPAAGATLACMRYADGVYDGTYGPTSVIGSGTLIGGPGGLFSNMRVVVDGLTVLAPYRPTYAGLDLYGVGQADIKSFSYFSMARTLGAAAGGWPPYVAGNGNPSAWQTFGYRSPTTGNNDQNDAGNLTFYGPYHGVVFADHFTAQSIKSVFCWFASTPAPQGGAGTSHHCFIASLSSEECSSPIFCDSGGGPYGAGGNTQALFVASMHAENADFLINDLGNQLYGEVHGEMLTLTGAFAGGKNGAANIRLVWDYQPLGVAGSPPAVPATTVALRNTFWRDATVYITSGGAAVQAIAVDGVTTGATLGTTGTVAVRVPNGQTITLTYASTAPTWAWVLE